MRRYYLLLIFFPGILFAQTKGQLSFGIDYFNVNNNMSEINQYLNNDSKFPYALYTQNQHNTMKNANGFGFGISYQPFSFQDIGIRAGYQFGQVKRTPGMTYPDPVTYYDVIYRGSYCLTAGAYSIQLTSKTYFNQLLHFGTSSHKFLHRFILATEIQLGAGFSKSNEEFSFVYPTAVDMQQLNYSAINLIGWIGLNIGYRLNESGVLSAFHLKAGYQFFKTSALKDRVGKSYYLDYPENNNALHLDFSGLTLGVALTLSK